MRITARLNRLDEYFGLSDGPRRGESRRDYLERLGRSRLRSRVAPDEVYLELVALHDRMDALEREVAELRSQR